MGMFDTVVLPKPVMCNSPMCAWSHTDFQTKDLQCILEVYSFPDYVSCVDRQERAKIELLDICSGDNQPVYWEGWVVNQVLCKLGPAGQLAQLVVTPTDELRDSLQTIRALKQQLQVEHARALAMAVALSTSHASQQQIAVLGQWFDDLHQATERCTSSNPIRRLAGILGGPQAYYDQLMDKSSHS